MYAEVDLSVLKPAITRLSKVTATRTTLPVLQNILIDAGEDELSLSANNPETALCFSIPAKVSHVGATTTNGRMLSALLSRIHGNELIISTTVMKQGNRFTIAIPDGPTIGLPAIDAAEFPLMMKPIQFKERYVLDAGEFRSLMYGTSFAAATDESRPVLQHIRLEFEPGKLTASATDGFRIAVKSTALDYSGEPFSVLIPAKMADTALKLLPIITGEKIVIGFKGISENTRTWVMIGAGNGWITGCLFDNTAKFPDWRSLVQSKYIYEYKLDRKKILSALDLAALIIGRYDNTTLILDFPKGKASASDEERGEFEFSIPGLDQGKPAPFICGICNRFFLEGLRRMKGDVVSMLMNSENQSFCFRDEGGMTYIVMPRFIG